MKEENIPVENKQVGEIHTEQAEVIPSSESAVARRWRSISKKKRLIPIAVIVVLIVIFVVFLLPNIRDGVGLFGGGTAAVVNGERIPETEVTAKIEALRSGYDNNDAWAAALDQAGLTPETLRDEIIDSLARNVLVLEYAKESKLEASEEDVEKVFKTSKDSFENDEAWAQYLSSNGFPSDKEYKEQIRVDLIKEQVVDRLAKEEGDTSSYDDWVSGLMTNAEIKVHAMPNGLPYDVGKKIDKSK